MARGYPDFWGTTIWMGYGPVIVSLGTTLALAAGSPPTVVHSITGKLKLYGGYVSIGSVTDMTQISVGVDVDGQVTGLNRLSAYREGYNLTHSYNPVVLVRYDEVAEIAVLAFVRDYSCQISYDLRMDNPLGAQITIDSRMFYTILR